jgi:hypothetical protein
MSKLTITSYSIRGGLDNLASLLNERAILHNCHKYHGYRDTMYKVDYYKSYPRRSYECIPSGRLNYCRIRLLAEQFNLNANIYRLIK